MPAPPNILCFVTDQHRADHLGCYGNPQVRTPNIDRLAAEGVLFTESYVANPVCMPNRASLFTGTYPQAHGLLENGFTLSPSEVVLPEVLRRAGYQTASFGKIHLAPFGMKPEQAVYHYELHESATWWEEGHDLSLPYYGFEEVRLADGHGPYIFGDYKRWLEAKKPGANELLRPGRAVAPPTGARECWKAAIPHELHYNTYIADRTVDFLRTRDSDRPFFAWCSFPDPHHPFSPPRPYCDMYDPRDIRFSPARRPGELDDLPPYFAECYRGERDSGGLRGDLRAVTDDHYREIIALTYGMISMVDDNVGRVMSALEEERLLEDTIIVFLSDHGDLMGDHWLINKGPFLYRGLVRVPTIWRLPGGARNQVCTQFVSAVDVCPTLLELCAPDLQRPLQGSSYAHLLRDPRGDFRDCIYIEYDESYLSDRLRQIRTKRWALTYLTQSRTGLLFDLAADPEELCNLWDKPKYQATRRDLLLELLQTSARAQGPPPVKAVHA